MAITQEFRFLDLPKDIRLEIYDLFPAETRRYTVKELNRKTLTPFNLVSRRIPCMELLTTCRQIFAEVSAMLGSRLDGQPIRIFTYPEDLYDIAINVISHYASSDCRNECLTTRIKRYDPSRQSVLDELDVPNVPLQALRHNTPATGSKLEVEIAIEPSWRLGLIGSMVRIFYKQIAEMPESQFFRYDRINITIRPKPSEAMSEKTISEGRVFDSEKYPKEFWLGKMWTCQLGECMTESEWQRNWEEGQHFGRLKRI